MSGHNKWSTIKHKKAAADAKRGKVFTRIAKEITIAAREGGGDADGHPRLRSPIAAAKSANMPNDNVKRAIQRGTGEIPGVSYEEVVYEGYGPGGVAILIECLTDNKNRTTPEIRHLFTKIGGSLGEPGSVAWMFDKRGNFIVPAADGVDEDRLMEVTLEAGAENLEEQDGEFVIQTSPDSFHAVEAALDGAGIAASEGKLVMEPQNSVLLDGDKAAQCLKLLDALEEHDDVQNVWANLDFDESQVASE
jgi:YebC/PmpR family DNA-binding regulatory protein